MCFKFRKLGHIKVNRPLLNRDKYKKKKKKVVFATSDKIDKSESEDSNKRKELLSCFMVLSNEVTTLNSNLHNCINKFDMPCYDELSRVLIELHKDVTSLKNEALKLKFSPLSKEMKY